MNEPWTIAGLVLACLLGTAAIAFLLLGNWSLRGICNAIIDTLSSPIDDLRLPRFRVPRFELRLRLPSLTTSALILCAGLLSYSVVLQSLILAKLSNPRSVPVTVVGEDLTTPIKVSVADVDTYAELRVKVDDRVKVDLDEHSYVYPLPVTITDHSYVYPLPVKIDD